MPNLSEYVHTSKDALHKVYLLGSLVIRGMKSSAVPQRTTLSPVLSDTFVSKLGDGAECALPQNRGSG